MTISLPPAKPFDWSNFALRAVSGGVLAGAALTAVWLFGLPGLYWRAPFLMMIAVGGVLLSIEWAKMATPRAGYRAMVVTSLAVAAVIFLGFLGQFAEACGVIVARAGVVNSA